MIDFLRNVSHNSHWVFSAFSWCIVLKDTTLVAFFVTSSFIHDVGGNFPGENFSGENFPRGEFTGENFPGENFPGGNFPATVLRAYGGNPNVIGVFVAGDQYRFPVYVVSGKGSNLLSRSVPCKLGLVTVNVDEVGFGLVKCEPVKK